MLRFLGGVLLCTNKNADHIWVQQYNTSKCKDNDYDFNRNTMSIIIIAVEIMRTVLYQTNKQFNKYTFVKTSCEWIDWDFLLI